MITQTAIVEIKATTQEEWQAVLTRLENITLPTGVEVEQNHVLKILTVNIPAQQVNL